MEVKKKIYIVLTQTGTVLSTLIKWKTREQYNHASISLENSLENMYSFGRYFASNPFFAGFIRENIKSGVFLLKPKAECCVYEVTVDSKIYDKLESYIAVYEKSKRRHGFNFLGMVSAGVNKPIRRKYKKYCAEFVSEALQACGIHDIGKHHSLARAHDFSNINGAQKIYEGLLTKYHV